MTVRTRRPAPGRKKEPPAPIRPDGLRVRMEGVRYLASAYRAASATISAVIDKRCQEVADEMRRENRQPDDENSTSPTDRCGE